MVSNKKKSILALVSLMLIGQTIAPLYGKNIEISKKSELKTISVGSKDNGIENLMATDIDKKSIIDIRKKEVDTLKATNAPISKTMVTNKKINYTEGSIVTINTLYNERTILELKDALKNDIEIEYISPPPQSFFTIEQNSNKLSRIFITPTSKFRSGTLMIGVKGMDTPIQIRLVESSSTGEYSNYFEIKLNAVIAKDIKLVKKIRSEVVRHALSEGFETLKEMDYEIISMKNKKFDIFNKDLLNIYFVESLKNSFYIVALNSFYSLEGYGDNMFSKYNSNKNIFILDFNESVFTITSKDTGERYRVILNGTKKHF